MAYQVPQELTDSISKQIEDANWPCSELVALAGGYTNFLFKGVLKEPLADGTTEIVIKHGERFLLCDHEAVMTRFRCVRLNCCRRQ